MAKMGKLSPEEEMRYKDLLRERDRERKRIKRMNPEYRRLEQERDRDRKKARRANEAFRQLEKLREKIRKERKKGIIVDEAALAQQFNLIAPTPVEPEVIISDPLPPNDSPTTTPHNINNHQLLDATITESHRRQRMHINNSNLSGNNTASVIGVTSTNTNTATSVAMGVRNTPGPSPPSNIPHVPHKSLLYPGPGFPHHPLPIPALLPCHPMLHHNLMYPQNGIKQEYNSSNDANSQNNQQISGGGGGISSNSNDDHDMPMIEPEIILQTSPEVIAAPHHFNNHTHTHSHSTQSHAHSHTHHLHQQQCHMFQHMTPPAHMTVHMRAHAANSVIPPTSPLSHNSPQAHNLITQQQQQPTQH